MDIFYIKQIKEYIKVPKDKNISTNFQFVIDRKNLICKFVFVDGYNTIYNIKLVENLNKEKEKNIFELNSNPSILFVVNGIGSSSNENYYENVYLKIGKLNPNVLIVPTVWKLEQAIKSCNISGSFYKDNPFKFFHTSFLSDIFFIITKTRKLEDIMERQIIRNFEIVKSIGISTDNIDILLTSGGTVGFLNLLKSGSSIGDIFFNNVFVCGSPYGFLLKIECLDSVFSVEDYIKNLIGVRFSNLYNIFFDFDPVSSLYTNKTPLNIEDTITLPDSRISDVVIKSNFFEEIIPAISGLIQHPSYFGNKKLHTFINSRITLRTTSKSKIL